MLVVNCGTITSRFFTYFKVLANDIVKHLELDISLRWLTLVKSSVITATLHRSNGNYSSGSRFKFKGPFHVDSTAILVKITALLSKEDFNKRYNILNL